MSRKTESPTVPDRGEACRAIEALVLDDLVCRPADLPRFAAVCPPPFHRWFWFRDHQLLALGLDALNRGATDLLAALAAISFSDAMSLLAGKQPKGEPHQWEDSVLAAIGPAQVGAMATAAGSLPPGTALTSDRWATLRAEGCRRAALAALQQAQADLQSVPLGQEPTAPIGLAVRALDAAAGQAQGEESIGTALAQALDGAEADAAARRSGTWRCASWGLDELDHLCPLRPGGLYVLAAQPGGGKTSLALQAATATAKGAGRGAVAIASLEMPGRELATILAGQELGIGTTWLRDRWEDLPTEDQQRVRDLAAKWSDEQSTLIYGGDAPTVEQLTAWIQGRAARGCSLAVVDYLGLINPGKLRGKILDATIHHTQTLKATARRCRIPILLLAQFTREGRKTTRNKDGTDGLPPEPRITDLMGGTSIEADADGAVLLWPKARPAQGKMLPVEIILAKHRHGPQGRFPALFSGAGQRFSSAVRTDRLTPEQRAAGNLAAADAFGANE